MDIVAMETQLSSRRHGDLGWALLRDWRGNAFVARCGEADPAGIAELGVATCMVARKRRLSFSLMSNYEFRNGAHIKAYSRRGR